MNEVSIIINGVRYDTVEQNNPRIVGCENCDIKDIC